MTAQPVAPGTAALSVRIAFHGPFRVGTGRPGHGFHESVDPDDLLPASSLKGLMRASAVRLLPGGGDPGTPAGRLLGTIFGTTRTPSPWHWSGAVFDEEGFRVLPRSRIAIDQETGTARNDHLVTAEEVWARTATFTVTHIGPRPRVSGALGDRLAVLACAAAGVHHVGAERRRGLGWVTCTPLGPALDDELLARFETLRSRHV